VIALGTEMGNMLAGCWRADESVTDSPFGLRNPAQFLQEIGLRAWLLPELVPHVAVYLANDEPITIWMRSSHARKWTAIDTVLLDDRIIDLKIKIWHLHGVSTEHQRLICGSAGPICGRPDLNDLDTLVRAGLRHQSVVLLFLRVRGS